MPEQDPSRFESLKQGAKEALQSLRNFGEGKLAIGLIGAVGVVGGGVAVANQLSTESASAANIPEATASDLQQDCIKDAVTPPKPAKAVMIHPGQFKKGAIQQTHIMAKYKAVKPECNDLVDRRGQYKLQLKTAKGRWYTSQGLWFLIATNKNDSANLYQTTTGQSRDLYDCRPVRILFRNRALDHTTHKELDERTVVKPVKISGKKKVCK